MKPTKTQNTKTPASISRSPDQGDVGLGFNGQDNSEGKSRSTKWQTNQHSGRQDPNKTFNFGRPASALYGLTGTDGGKGPLKAPNTKTVPDYKAAAKQAFAGTLNTGKQERNPGGSRPYDARAEGNYVGDSDRINFGRGPTKGTDQGTHNATMTYKSGSNPTESGKRKK